MIAHADLQSALRRQCRVDFDLTSRRHMLRCIVQHVGERLGQQPVVELEQLQVLRADKAQRMRQKLTLEWRGGRMDHIEKLAPVRRGLHRIGFDAGDLQKVLHDALKPPRGRVDLRCEGI